MIPYSLPKHIRYTAYLGIFLSAAFLQEWIAQSLPFGHASISGQSLTAGFIAAMLFYAFEKVLWKLPGYVNAPVVPDFSGEWYGYITRRQSYEAVPEHPPYFRERDERYIPVLLTIHQNFSDIG